MDKQILLRVVRKLDSKAATAICNGYRELLTSKASAKQSPLKSNAGFTFIEVIIVTLMIGILSAIAVPSWLAFANRQRVNMVNEAVLRALQQAQQEAKSTKRRYSVSFKVENQLPKSIVYPTNATGSVPNSSDPRWISLGEYALKRGQVFLYTNIGTANNVVSSITLADNSNPRTITFDYTGALPPPPFSNLGSVSTGSSEPPGLKVVVAEAKPGTSPAPNVAKQCAILRTLLGGMQTGKANECQ